MAFQKTILILPQEGFTGETKDHKVTKANITNQPELTVRGIKEGDTIKIIPNPVTAATQTKDSKKDEKSGDAPEKDNKSTGRAAEIAERFGVEKVFENTETGEYFTSENLALLSTGDKSKLKTHSF